MVSNPSLAKVRGTEAFQSPGVPMSWLDTLHSPRVARELLDTSGPTSQPGLEHLTSSEW